MKPAIIVKVPQGYDAYNEDGRFLLGCSCAFQRLCFILEQDDYEIVSHNSRIGRTILDKLESRGIRI